MKVKKRGLLVLSATLFLVASVISPLAASAKSNLALPDGYIGTGANFGDNAIVVRVDEGVRKR